MLLAFNRRHDDVQGLKKMKQQPWESTTTTNNNSNIVLVSLYTLPTHWTELLRLPIEEVIVTQANSSEARQGTGMLTVLEIQNILDAYLQCEELIVRHATRGRCCVPLTTTCMNWIESRYRSSSLPYHGKERTAGKDFSQRTKNDNDEKQTTQNTTTNDTESFGQSLSPYFNI